MHKLAQKQMPITWLKKVCMTYTSVSHTAAAAYLLGFHQITTFSRVQGGRYQQDKTPIGGKCLLDIRGQRSDWLAIIREATGPQTTTAFNQDV